MTSAKALWPGTERQNVTAGVTLSSLACRCAFVLCSGASACGAKAAAEVEDEHRHAKRGQARRRQVSLQSHQE